MIRLIKVDSQLLTEEYLHGGISRIAKLLDYDVAKLIAFDESSTYATFERVFIRKGIDYNVSYKDSKRLIKHFSNCVFALLIKTKQIVFLSKNEDDKADYLPLIEEMENEIYIPLFSGNSKSREVTGCLYLGSTDKTKVVDGSTFLDKDISRELSIIQNLYQLEYIKISRKKRMLNVIYMMSQIIREREPYMVTHPYNVAQWSLAIGKELGFNEKRLETLYLSAVLHDLGKIYISADILNKPTKLTNEEYEKVKKHSIYSYRIIKNMFDYTESFNEIAIFTKHHHERYDGTGYPDGLKGEEIPLESRIISVADAVDAMMSNRTYKKAKSINLVINELIKNKGKQFDPNITKIMIEILMKSKAINEQILSEPIIWGTLLITTSEKEYFVEGTLVRNEDKYKFMTETFDFDNDVEKSKITDIRLYLEKNQNVNEYDVKIEKFYKNELYISEIKAELTGESFSMLWDLEGLLIDNTKKIYNINITRIGGNFMSFYIDDSEINNNEEDKILKVIIRFEDDYNIVVSGKINKSYCVGAKKYYDFSFINISDSVRDNIFRQLFKKQIETRKSIVYSLANSN
ncbi:HD-GYP domain-containing protein [Caloranaerobacter sp. TR13]|uniref:HD-GYP domain-containing protein n=1 Tax=Caloranaerobacter sp. TR13 TaxID=1302151 RepID=UPI0006D42710|nr:HD-GYP domain-containing protein [Caloranaerobacter sp. TR13]